MAAVDTSSPQREVPTGHDVPASLPGPDAGNPGYHWLGISSANNASQGAKGLLVRHVLSKLCLDRGDFMSVVGEVSCTRV